MCCVLNFETFSFVSINFSQNSANHQILDAKVIYYTLLYKAKGDIKIE